MTKNEKMEIYKAINDVSKKVNDVSLKLDELILKLNDETNKRININANAVDDIAEMLSTHDSAIDELATIVVEGNGE